MDVSTALSAAPTRERVRADFDRGVLCGTRCRSCGAASWPSRSLCFRCGSPDVGNVWFPPTGSLLTYTTVWLARPGLTVPYVLGQVHLDEDGPVVFGHVREIPQKATVPQPMQLRLGHPDETPWYWFEPKGDADG